MQWYFDIISDAGIEDGRPWFEDCYLDIVAFPDGSSVQLDMDELEEACIQRKISTEMKEKAIEIAEGLRRKISENFPGLVSYTCAAFEKFD